MYDYANPAETAQTPEGRVADLICLCGEHLCMHDQILDAVQAVAAKHDFTNRNRDAESYFCRRLREAFVQTGWSGVPNEVQYVDCSRKCDLHVCIGESNVYLEAKLLFPHYWEETRGQRYRDKQRLFEPLILFGKHRESHSVAQDLEKLATHSLPNAHYLGVLVIASYTEQNHCMDDFAEFARLANLASPWIGGARQFANCFWTGFFLDARIWMCPATEIEKWWSIAHPRFQNRG